MQITTEEGEKKGHRGAAESQSDRGSQGVCREWRPGPGSRRLQEDQTERRVRLWLRAGDALPERRAL